MLVTVPALISQAAVCSLQELCEGAEGRATQIVPPALLSSLKRWSVLG